MDIAFTVFVFAMGAAIAAIFSFFLTFIRNSMLANKGEITVLIKKGGHTIEILNPTSDQIDKLLRQLRDEDK